MGTLRSLRLQAAPAPTVTMALTSTELCWDPMLSDGGGGGCQSTCVERGGLQPEEEDGAGSPHC